MNIEQTLCIACGVIYGMSVMDIHMRDHHGTAINTNNTLRFHIPSKRSR